MITNYYPAAAAATAGFTFSDYGRAGLRLLRDTVKAYKEVKKVTKPEPFKPLGAPPTKPEGLRNLIDPNTSNATQTVGTIAHKLPSTMPRRNTRRVAASRIIVQRAGRRVLQRRRSTAASLSTKSIKWGPAQEKKYLDSNFTLTPYCQSRSGDTCVALLNGLTQTTSQSGRVGNYVTMKSVQLRFHMNGRSNFGNQYQFGITSIPQCIRVMMVYYKDNAGVNRVTSNSLISSVLQNATTTPILQPNNMGEATKFNILMDKIYYMGGPIYFQQVDSFGVYSTGAVNSVQGPVCLYDQAYIKLNLQTQYSQNIVTGDAIQKGALYIIVLSSMDNVANTVPGAEILPRFLCTARIRYTDD